METSRSLRSPSRQRMTRSVWLISLVLMLALLLGASGSMTIAQPGRAVIRPNVLEALKTQGAVKVIINLATGSTIVNRGVYTTEINTAQSSVLAAMPAGSFTLSSRFKTIPAMSGVITRDGLLALRNHPSVTSVNLNKEVFLADHVQAAPRYDDQAKLLHRAHELNALGYTGEGSRIAVIDTGIDNQHPSTALLSDLFFQRCFRTEGDCVGGVTSAEDQDSHGTHVAGIITGQHGVAPDAEFAALKVFTATGSTSDENILNALDYAADNDATLDLDGINMSLGGGLYATQAECDADNAAFVTSFAALNALGIAVFVATGNSYATTGVSSPGCVTGAIGIGSVDDAEGVWDERSAPDVVTSFSNATPLQGDGELVDVLAPGCAILSEIPPDLNGGMTTDSYCGTSMATPTVAGIFAALIEFDSMTPAEAENVLEVSGDLVIDDRPNMGNLAFPRINAMSAYGSIFLITPTDLTATVISATQIDLAWTDVAGDSHYVVERKSAHSTVWTQIGTTAVNVVEFSDTAPTCGLTTYRVRSSDGTATSLPSNEAIATAFDCPSAPTNLIAAEAAVGVDLSWTDNATDETAYSIERKTTTGGFAEIATTAANVTTYTDTTTVCGIYQYRVRAYRAGDNAYSAYSNVAVFAECTPANNEFANAEPITLNPSTDVETDFRYASIGAEDPAFTCHYFGENYGGNSVWYSFTTASAGTVSINTFNSTPLVPAGTPDTLLAIYTYNSETFTEVACNDDGGVAFLSSVNNVPVAAGTTYYVIVANWSQSLTSIGNIDVLEVNFSTTAELVGGASELVTNGSFEIDANNDKQPESWSATNITRDRIKCDKSTKTFARGGVCAYQFRGVVGENARLTQRLSGSGMAIGDTLEVSMWVKTNVAAAGKVMTIRMTYTDNTREKMTVNMTAPAAEYTQMTDSMTLAKDVSQVRIRLQYRVPSGKVLVDDVSVAHVSGSGSRQAGDNGLIPLPESSMGGRDGGDKTSEDSNLGRSQ